jgi:DNA processing protein
VNDIKYWVALNRVPQLGTVRVRRLEAYFGDLENAWTASLSHLREAGIDTRVARELEAVRTRISPDGEMERLAQAGVKAVHWHHPDYPPRLKEIHDPPPVLYFKGQLLPDDERSVAVVGTRSPTAYGRQVATLLATDLARHGITIVSGLARGIDGIAHRAALESNGRTIAIVGTGLDIVYPPEHAHLFQQIQEQGAVASEYPLGVRPNAQNFPRRNRLMSGISLGTLVVEAGDHSGAIWTVQHALEQNREVFCVPGSIFSPVSSFTNRMIQEGAKLVSKYEDILEELNLTAVASQMQMPLLPAPVEEGEAGLLRHLDHEPVHIDDLRRRAGLPITEVSSLLSLMELKGLVKQVGCMHYIRLREATTAYAP